MGKLLDHFEAVFDRPYNDNSDSDRDAIQYLIYLAEHRGLGLGSHWFIWKDRNKT